MINEFGGVIHCDALANRPPEEWELERPPINALTLAVGLPSQAMTVVASSRVEPGWVEFRAFGSRMIETLQGTSILDSLVLLANQALAGTGVAPQRAEVSPLVWAMLCREVAACREFGDSYSAWRQ